MSVFLWGKTKKDVEKVEEYSWKNRNLYIFLSIFANVFTFFEEFVIIQR